MNNYITGKIIQELREKHHLTQAELAAKLSISDKTVSKWETGKGLPDISLIEPISEALNISVIELMNGEYITNKNQSGNMIKSHFYVCPICGNVIHSMGENVNSCCGITLPKLEGEIDNSEHEIAIESIENEFFVTINHDMSKHHYLSFIAYVTLDRCEIVKMYPEQDPSARFFKRGHGIMYTYCNKDGLFKKRV